MNQFKFRSLSICFLLVFQLIQMSEGNILNFLKTLITESTISTDKSKVKFFLYPSAQNPEYKEEIEIGNTVTLQESSYKKSLPLKVIIHGFLSDKDNDVTHVIKTAYMEELYDVNIVGVDWTELSTAKSVLPEIFYPTASNNVATVGKQLANFLEFLIKSEVLTGPEDVHLIGFSLGAHIAGMAGLYFHQDTGEVLDRITGLDPAGPIFQLWIESERLDKSDANFVDVTHTNDDGFGFNSSLGHADFYANGGGPIQPHCSNLGVLADSCSHSSAYKYFAKSIREKPIVACLCRRLQPSDTKYEECMKNCQNQVDYGEKCIPDARGDYYFQISIEN